jgi:glycosyltransferase involved in cell wall biosynthesis
MGKNPAENVPGHMQYNISDLYTGYEKKPRICFIAHNAYGALSGGVSGHIGGVERQTSMMARWLAERGYKVSVVTWDEGQDDGVEIDSVKVFRLCRKDAGIKGLRFFWPRWTSLVAALSRADADVYYQNCGEYVTGQVALWCRRHGRKFIYSVASDPDCDARLPKMHKLRERILYRYGLKAADKIIVQTRRQRDMLRASFKIDSVVVPMPCPGPTEGEYTNCEREQNGSPHVLWIGRICEVKRPDRLLDLAEACPDLIFDLVGPTSDSEYARSVCRRAKNIKNVHLHGSVARERVPDFYKKASIMCCTSDFEGFPNTFLEAWSYGLPIISTIDPDNLIAERGLGKTGKDITDLAAGIRELIDLPQKWQKASQSAREYYLENHVPYKAMERFEHVFCNVDDSSVNRCDGGDI